MRAALRSVTLVASAMLATLLGAPAADAQTPAQKGAPDFIYAMGAATAPAEAVEGIPVVSLTRAYLPEAVSLVDLFPEPGDQKDTGACVAWATAYGARSYYNALLASTQSRPSGSQIASPAYLHNLTYAVDGKSAGCKEGGAVIPMAMAVLQKHGTLAHQDYGYDHVCESTSTDVRAGRNRIAGMRKIAWTPRRTSPQYNAAKTTPMVLDKVRQMLAAGHPVIIGMEVGPAFHSLKPGTIYQETIAESKDGKKGGHAMVVVGYDDRRSAFYVLNSWGRRWADGGYGWISYRSFAADVVEAYTMEVAGVTPPVPSPGRPPVPSDNVPRIESLRCADVRIERGGERLTGFVRTFEDKRTLDVVARREGSVNAVAVRPWPVCEALLTLREPLRAPSRPVVSIDGGRPPGADAGAPGVGDAVLKVGDRYSIRITAPDVPSFLYAVYIEDDGTVVNLIPRRGPIRKQTMPGEQVVIGDGREGRASFSVTRLKSPLPPGHELRGHEAVVVVAARAPIQELEDQEGADSPIYRAAARGAGPGADDKGPPDRLLLSLLRDITRQRVEASMLPREVAAAVVHIKIEE